MSKGFRQYRKAATGSAAAAVMDLAGRRWALRVVWELRAGALTFRALQAACGGISPSVLQTRLHELGAVGVIETIPRLGYRLTASGEALYQELEGLADWAESNCKS